MRAQLPNSELHVFGAHCSPHHISLTRAAEGFFVKGYAEGEARETLEKYRALLAPLPYGAGIKGKVADAWAAGTPVVTTTIGAEGMYTVPGEQEGEGSFAGAVCDDDEGFVRAAVSLYSDEGEWRGCSERGRLALASLFDHGAVTGTLLSSLEEHYSSLEKHRRADLMRGVVWNSRLRSLEYLSKYITAKEKGRRACGGVQHKVS